MEKQTQQETQQTAPQVKKNYGMICVDFGVASVLPTQELEGTKLRFDFNSGCRLYNPQASGRNYRVEVFDADTGHVYTRGTLIPNTGWVSPIKYYRNYEIRVSSNNGDDISHVQHKMNLKDKMVHFKICQRTLGDPIALFSAIPIFMQKHHCRARVFASARIAEIFKMEYPEIEFVLLENEVETKMYEEPYATYYLGLFFEETISKQYQPYDFRTHGLHEQGAHILGFEPELIRAPKVTIAQNPTKRKKKKSYVAISVMGSKHCKFWNNPIGWKTVITYLNREGFDVACIDRDSVYGTENVITTLPHGVIDMTGDKPLQDTLNLIGNAEFLICTASGPAWLGWCAKVPVIMISGFSLPYAEFPCHRVINTVAKCIGCWNDSRINFSHHEYTWCPRVDVQIEELRKKLYTTTDKEAAEQFRIDLKKLEEDKFTCTKSIEPYQVITEIKRVLGR